MAPPRLRSRRFLAAPPPTLRGTCSERQVRATPGRPVTATSMAPSRLRSRRPLAMHGPSLPSLYATLVLLPPRRSWR
jgi:hypothetical protein